MPYVYFLKASILILMSLTNTACINNGAMYGYIGDIADRVDVEIYDTEGIIKSIRIYSTKYNSETGTSTSGTADLIYRDTDLSGSFAEHAMRRAKLASECQHAFFDHYQRSVRGTHVVVHLEGCPPIQRS